MDVVFRLPNFICSCQSMGSRSEENGMSNATINRCISAISTVLNHCSCDDLCGPPPKFKRRKETEGRILFFTKEDVNQMCHASVDVFNRMDLAEIIQVAAFTGMRQGELLKLKARDIDLSLNTIHVGGRPDVVTKAGNYRSIPSTNASPHPSRIAWKRSRPASGCSMTGPPRTSFKSLQQGAPLCRSA